MSKSKLKNESNILMMISGSIAAFKACQVISDLKKMGHRIKVVVTPTVFNFIGRSSLEALSGENVHSEIFEKDQSMAHIYLERWADLIVFCPATASSLNKMAAGIGDDLVTTLYLSHEFKKPFFIFPAMNQAMWNHPTTKSSILKLRSFGLQIIEPDSGALACGEEGAGRLLDPKEIVAIVTGSDAAPNVRASRHSEELPRASTGIKSKSNFLKRVLITGGGTEERIDDVRVLTNLSTGSTAALIAEAYAGEGAQVTYLASRSARLPHGAIDTKRFQSFESLQDLIKFELSQTHFDIIIHCAAVSDYRVLKIENAQGEIHQKKISSSSPELSIHLIKNPKLLNFIAENSPKKKTVLVAFKLTSGADNILIDEEVKKLFSQPGVDFVLQNDLENITDHTHHFALYRRSNSGVPVVRGNNKSELVHSLLQEVEKHLISIQNEEEWI